MDRVIELLIEINDKLESQRDDIFYTRKQAQAHYDMSERETAKLFNKLLKDKIVDIGKEQRLAKIHIDELFRQGIVSK